MTANKKSPPKCPACNKSFVDEDGRFSICPRCPYREVPNEVKDNYTVPIEFDSDDSGNDTITVKFDLARLLGKLAEQQLIIQTLRKELAEMHFNSND